MSRHRPEHITCDMTTFHTVAEILGGPGHWEEGTVLWLGGELVPVVSFLCPGL